MRAASQALSARARRPATTLGPLLRYWRGVRGKSQLDLALDAGLSQRHVSFVESGRSTPGRDTLLGIAEALDVPLRDRNGLLLAAGYAPLFPDAAWDAPDMQIVTRALQRMLRQHEPFPAVVMDRHWTVLMANAAAPRFFNGFVDLASREGPRNLLHLMFDPKGMRPFILEWDRVAKALIGRVHREAVGGVVDPSTRSLLDALLAYPDVQPAWATAADPAPLPVIPLSFAKGGTVLRYFSMVTTVGTPQTIAAQELRLECLFPADDATEQHALDAVAEGPKAPAPGL